MDLDKGPWTCSVCTFQNIVNVPVCAMCKQGKPPSSANDDNDDFTNWRCSTCTHVNDVNSTSCKLCGESNPNLTALHDIILNKHRIEANITERYAIISYLFDFKNSSEYGISKELKFDITIDPNAFISGFTANIDGEVFTGKTKPKEEAKKEYIEAKETNENAVLIYQTDPNIPNVFTIKTNIDSDSKISLKLTIEQFVTKVLNFNALNMQILKH
eukprot:520109_1